jgi:hypothetical protein
MPADKFGHPPPIVQSMILADHVHRDPSNGKYFILGTFNHLGSTKFPTAQIPLCLFMAITDAHGPTMLRIRIIDVDDDRVPIHDSVHPIDLPDPNRVYEMTFNVAVAFPAPGDYRIQLFGGGEFLRELRLRVVPPKAPSSEEP